MLRGSGGSGLPAVTPEGQGMGNGDAPPHSSCLCHIPLQHTSAVVVICPQKPPIYSGAQLAPFLSSPLPGLCPATLWHRPLWNLALPHGTSALPHPTPEHKHLGTSYLGPPCSIIHWPVL